MEVPLSNEKFDPNFGLPYFQKFANCELRAVPDLNQRFQNLVQTDYVST